jgi:hypothetical protein
MTFLYILILFLVVCACAALTLLGLPGNWGIVLVTLLFSMLVPPATGLVIGAPVLIGMVTLALLGELLEFFLSAAGLARGASRRGAILALLGSVLGSFVGAVVLSIFPIIGTVIGLILGGATGAMIGAVIGEKSSGKDTAESIRLGKIAFWGRLFGSLTKIFIAGLLVAIAVVAAIL